MFSIKTIPPEKLVALKFVDAATFRRAARVAAERRIPVDAPGLDTLVVQESDKCLFASEGLKFEERRVAEPEKVEPKQYSELRRFHSR